VSKDEATAAAVRLVDLRGEEARFERQIAEAKTGLERLLKERAAVVEALGKRIGANVPRRFYAVGSSVVIVEYGGGDSRPTVRVEELEVVS
jgi:hypothetical protein